jgi:hypothetical protein
MIWDYCHVEGGMGLGHGGIEEEDVLRLLCWYLLSNGSGHFADFAKDDAIWRDWRYAAGKGV